MITQMAYIMQTSHFSKVVIASVGYSIGSVPSQVRGTAKSPDLSETLTLNYEANSPRVDPNKVRPVLKKENVAPREQLTHVHGNMSLDQFLVTHESYNLPTFQRSSVHHHLMMLPFLQSKSLQ